MGAAEQDGDPLALVAGIYSETGSPADLFGSVDFETGIAPIDYTVLNATNSFVNLFGKLGNLGLNLLYVMGKVQQACEDFLVENLGFTEADVSFLEVYFAANPGGAERDLTQSGAQALAKFRQLAAERGWGTSSQELADAWRAGLRVKSGIRAGSGWSTSGEGAGPVVARAADALGEGLHELSGYEAHVLVGSEKHHPIFSMLIRAFDKAGFGGVRTPGGNLRPQSLVDLATSVHQDELHGVWDLLYPHLARGRGASSRVAQLIREGTLTPSKILDRLETFYRATLSDRPEDLQEILDSIASYRRRSGL